MAGIGFQLKRLFRENKGYYHSIKAYAYSSLVTIGPMLMCMVTMIAIQEYMKLANERYLEKELFLAAAEYAFIFSLLATSGFSMLLSRYIADKLYKKEQEDILPSFYGTATVCLIIGGTAGALFLSRSPLSPGFKISAYLLFMELTVIWLQAVYMTALKDYTRIVRSFMIGMGATVLTVLLFLIAWSRTDAAAMLASMDAGFFVIAVLFAVHLESSFKSGKKNYFAFFAYVFRYPSLMLTGLFYTAGIYAHNMAQWGSRLGITVGGAFRYAPSYDVPVFYAFMTTLPAMVIFVVSMETHFYDKYKQYFATVLNAGTLQEIMRARKDMLHTLFQELCFLMEIQLFFSVCSLAAGQKWLPHLGFSSDETDTFVILVLGDFLYIVMFIFVLLLLYFDDRRGALGVTSVFLGCNLLLAITGWYAESNGFPFFLAALAALLASVIRLFIIVENVNYYTFCSQPIVAGNKEELPEKLARWAGKWRKRRLPGLLTGGKHD